MQNVLVLVVGKMSQHGDNDDDDDVIHMRSI